MKSKTVTIVGAGVIGAFTAYYLLKKGWQVTIVDKGRFGCGSSEGNCGLVVPNHILPLNSSGTLLKAFKWMFSKEAPLHVKPRLDWNLFHWFFKFSLKCGRADILAAAKGRHALLQSSWQLFPDVIKKEALDCSWDACGSLHVYLTEKEWNAYRVVDIFLGNYGLGAEPMNREELLAFEPSLSPDVFGGWRNTQTAHLYPEKLMEAMRSLIEKNGATIIEETEVTGFEKKDDRVVGVVAGETVLPSGAVVVATGAWTPMLQNQLGCDIPIQPGKGYSVTSARPPHPPSVPCFFEEKSVVATPWPDGFRLGGTMEFAGYDDSLDQRRLSALTKGAGQYMKETPDQKIEKEWCSFRPMTFDGLPVVDRSPLFQNVIIAAGHNMLGISMATGTGKLVSEMLNGESPHLDLKPYQLKRFHPK